MEEGCVMKVREESFMVLEFKEVLANEGGWCNEFGEDIETTEWLKDPKFLAGPK